MSQSEWRHDSFNARNLTPAEVAQTFVPPAEFQGLVQPTNAVIVGPRGSGKTTLLKMLHQEALEVWDHPVAQAVASVISYSTAFIATDRRWSTQLESLGGGELTPAAASEFALAAYTTQVLRALVNAMLARVHRDEGTVLLRRVGRVEMSRDLESELSTELANSWRLDVRMGSLVAVRQALTQRLVEIRWLAAKRAEDNASVSNQVSRNEWLMLPFLDAAVSGIERFNDAVNEPHRRWALAFDELELAPPAVLTELATAIRAADEHLLFKLALSPGSDLGSSFGSALSASPGHDYREIRLWYPDRGDGESFCRDLWRAALLKRGLYDRDPMAVLGPSYFEPRAGPTGDDYEPGSKWSELFKEMSARDTTFREYLTKKRIDPEHLNDMVDRDRAADVRKIAPLLPLREFYRQSDRDSPEKGRRRSRKSPTLYTGASCLFAITEANPRWFKNLFDGLLDHMSDQRIEPRFQADAVQAMAQRFAALLKTVPAPTIMHRGAVRGVLGIVREIGARISDDHVVEAFKPEPLATFVIHSDAPDSLLRILEEAANWGAIIYVPDHAEQNLLGSLKGKRFRIAYSLAPLYGLPVRLGKPMSLKSVFSRRSLNQSPGLPFPKEPEDGTTTPDDSPDSEQ